MTYLELMEALSKLTDEQLKCNVTVKCAIPLDEGECAAADLDITDEGHPVIYVWEY